MEYYLAIKNEVLIQEDIIVLLLATRNIVYIPEP